MLAKGKFTQLGLSSFFTDSFLFSKKCSLSIYHVLHSLLYARNIVISKTRSSWSTLVRKTKTKISKSIMKEIKWWQRLWRSPVLTKWSRSPLWRCVAWAKKWSERIWMCGELGGWQSGRWSGKCTCPEPGGRWAGVVRKGKRGHGKEWAGNF